MSTASPTRGRAINAAEIAASAIRILRLPEVCQVTGLKRAMIYRLQQKKLFPQSVKITDHAVGWIDAEVRGWLEQRMAARHGGARGKNSSR